MPTFQKDFHCICGFRFTAAIRTQPGDGPNTEYVVYCPSNGSRLKVLRRDLTEEIEEPPPPPPPVKLPPAPEPWQTDSLGRLVFVGVVLLLCLAAVVFVLW